jgi:hypothetical protein
MTAIAILAPEETIETHKQLKENAGRLEPLLVYSDSENEAIEALRAHIEHYYREQVNNGKRSRMLGQKALDKRLRLAVAIFCNFKLSHGMPLSYARGGKFFPKKDRYRADWYTREVLLDVIKILTHPEVDLIRETKGSSYEFNPFGGEDESQYLKIASIMELTENGKEFLSYLNRDLIGNERVELIVLSSNERFGRKKLKELIHYEDTEETLRWREEVQVINDYLQFLFIEGADGENLSNFELYRGFSRNERFSDFRYFGRLEGMPWSNWQSGRRRAITIDGYSVREIDFRACSLSILANLNGTPLNDPDVDPYQVGRLAEFNREAVKGIIQTILNQGKLPKRIPSDIKKKLSYEHQKLTMGDFLPIVLRYYPFLESITVHPSFIESEISVKVMLKAIEEELMVIPHYDAFYVAEDDLSAVEHIVNTVSEELTGHPLYFSIK